MKGYAAVCEPNGEALCVYGEGSFLGDFQVVKHIPCFFMIQAIDNCELETQFERENGVL
jgi:hypothetical protein